MALDLNQWAQYDWPAGSGSLVVELLEVEVQQGPGAEPVPGRSGPGLTVEAQAVLDGAQGRVQRQRPGGQRLHGGPRAALRERPLELRRTPEIICRSETDSCERRPGGSEASGPPGWSGWIGMFSDP